MAIQLLTIAVIQLIFFYFLDKFSKKFNFLDYPDSRKIHDKPTSYLGGIGILATYFILVFLTISQNNFIHNIIIYGSLVAFIGLVDDKISITPVKKLVAQTILILFFIYKNSLYLNDIGTFQYIGKVGLGNFNIIFTLLCCLLLINSFNYSDGIDGLAILNYIFIISIYIFLSHYNNLYDIRDFLILLIVPAIIFLKLNFGYKKIKFFLGDSGSNLLGFIISFVSIGMYTKYNFHPILIMWPLSFLVYEFLSTNFLRIINKKNIVSPGHDHLHYELKLIYKLNRVNINILIFLYSTIVTLIGYFTYYKFNEFISLLFYILFFFLFLYFRIKLNYQIKKLI
jgi:UDP-GlcNAc:undecaprenyl-phosphate GlcNAc-1-phosphate transferase